jgi:Glycosyl transferase family 2
MNEPLVSVVMVVCNVERFLAEAIESILRQTFRDFEFIIFDFGSTDRSKTIASNFAAKDGRVKLHEIPTCSLPEARNAASFLAQGRYIAVMDADDVAAPERLMSEVEFMEKHPEVGVLGGATEWIDANGKSLHLHSFPTEDRELRSALTKGCPFWHATVLIRKEAFDLSGGYRPVFLQAEDYDLWLRIAEHYDCANLKQVVLKYRIHPYQVSMRRQRQQALCVLAAQSSASARKNGIYDPLNSMGEITPATVDALGVTEATQQRVLAAECLRWVQHMCMAGETSTALEAAIEMLQYDWEFADSWRIADLHLIIARLYWERRQVLRSVLALGRAVATRPIIVGRPLKELLGRLRGDDRPRQTAVAAPQERVISGDAQEERVGS